MSSGVHNTLFVASALAVACGGHTETGALRNIDGLDGSGSRDVSIGKRSSRDGAPHGPESGMLVDGSHDEPDAPLADAGPVRDASLDAAPSDAFVDVANEVDTRCRPPDTLRIVEYPVASRDSGPTREPSGTTIGPDGRIWFGLSNAGLIGAMDESGRLTTFPLRDSHENPVSVASAGGAIWFGEYLALGRMSAGDGAVTGYVALPPLMNGIWQLARGDGDRIWFVDTANEKIARVDPDLSLAEFPIPGKADSDLRGGEAVQGIVLGPDDNVWFAYAPTNSINRVTADGSVTPFALPYPRRLPALLAFGPDGAVWFTGLRAPGQYIVGRMTLSGDLMEFPAPYANGAWSIVSDGRCALWLTEDVEGKILRVGLDGSMKEYPIPTSGARPRGMTRAPNGRMWFSEFWVDQLAAFDPFGGP